MVALFNKLFNRKLKKFLLKELEAGCYLVFGQRGAGKSTLFADIAYTLHSDELAIYSNYGYDNTFKLPYVQEFKYDKQGRVIDVELKFDKNTLYNYKFKNCVILIDEGKTIWSNRDYKYWTAKDDNFINYLRKNNVILIVATQDYEGLDLNLRKACNMFFYMRRSDRFKNFTKIELYSSEVLPVVDKELEVRSSLFRKPFNLMSFQIGCVIQRKYNFYRTPFYNMFDTDEIIELPKEDPPKLYHEGVKYDSAC